MPKHPNSKHGLLIDVLSAKERAKIIEIGVNEMLDKEEFFFKAGQGYLTKLHGKPCGCAVGAVCQFLGGRSKKEAAVFEGIEDTGLATEQEMVAVEQGYERGDGKGGPFFELGKRLRARDDADPNWVQKD
jgi:hypothetical protein